MGFTIVWNGSSGVIWAEQIPVFPYYTGVGPIILSWFIAPIVAFIIAVLTFLLNRWGRVNHSVPTLGYLGRYIIICTYACDIGWTNVYMAGKACLAESPA